MLGFQFVLARGWSSYTIQLFGGGTQKLGFSHVDIILPHGLMFGTSRVTALDGELFGARSDSIGGKPPGVQRRPFGYGASTWIRRETFKLSVTQKQQDSFYSFLFAQEGKPYDKTAIAAFVFDRDWRADDSWFCDELAAAATEVANACPTLYLPANKLSPTAWAVVLSALGAASQVEAVSAK